MERGERQDLIRTYVSLMADHAVALRVWADEPTRETVARMNVTQDALKDFAPIFDARCRAG